MTESGRQDYLVGKYRPLLSLGKGGMALVSLASYEGESEFRKLVVLKSLRPSLSADPEMRRTFLAEARLTARMNHPNVVQVREVFEVQGNPVIAMEYLEGHSYDLVLTADEVIPLHLRLYILSEALRGLEYFHELEDESGRPLHLVHRDLSPHNIFVTCEGTVKVLDFGIAKSEVLDTEDTKAGIVKGKFRYMAPEQTTGERIDHRADLFAVGVMLWEALATKRLYGTLDQGQILKMVLSGSWPSIREAAPGLPESLYQTVECTLRAQPGERVADAGRLRQLLCKGIAELGAGEGRDELRAFMTRAFGSEMSQKRRRIGSRLNSPMDRWSEPPPNVWSTQTSRQPLPDSSADATLYVGSGPSAVQTTMPSQRSTLIAGASVLVFGTLVGGLILTNVAAQPQAASQAKDELGTVAEASMSVSPSPETELQKATPAEPADSSEWTQGPKPTYSSPPTPCRSPQFLDDFEDGDGRPCAFSENPGIWSLFYDGTGTLDPEPGHFLKAVELNPPRGASKRGLQFAGSGLKEWGAGVAVAFSERSSVDLSQYEGVRLWIYSPHPVAVRVKLATMDTLGSTYGGRCEPTTRLCEDHFSFRRVVGPNWYLLQARFDEMQQMGFGPPAKLNLHEAKELHIGVDLDNKEELNFKVIIDDVQLF